MTSVLIFLGVLGILIFVHELGHFIAAKMCHVYVDRFSLGMPPRIFGFKYGETDYCIGLLPIGGYVKMAGQEDAPLSEEERESTYGKIPPERWFNNRPRHQRAFILLAGPAMNLVLGFIIYAIMVGVGGEVPVTQFGNRLGLIETDSPASKAELYRIAELGDTADVSGDPDAIGLKTGDRIITFNGKEVRGVLQDIAVEAILADGEPTRMEVEREEVDGSVSHFVTHVSAIKLNDEPFPRFGIAPYNTFLVQRVREGSPAADAGLQDGDKVIKLDGEFIEQLSFLRAIQELEGETEFELLVEREGDEVPITVQTRTRGMFEGIAVTPSLNPFIATEDGDVLSIRNSDAEFQTSSGLKNGYRVVAMTGVSGDVSLRSLPDLPADTLLTIALEKPSRFFGLFGGGDAGTADVTAGQVVEGLTGFAADAPVEIALAAEATEDGVALKRRDVILEIDGQPATVALLKSIESTRVGETLSIRVKRPAIWFGLGQKESEFDAEVSVRSLQEIGIVFAQDTVFHKAAPAEIIPEAWDRCVRTSAQIGVTLKKLVTGGLSPKLLGGPVMIFEVTTGAARTNMTLFLDTLAMISINLCWFNLLPLPVLDGGQLMFLGIEAVRRKPVSMKVMETVQQFGLILILGLIVFVSFNDISRIVERFLP